MPPKAAQVHVPVQVSSPASSVTEQLPSSSVHLLLLPNLESHRLRGQIIHSNCKSPERILGLPYSCLLPLLPRLSCLEPTLGLSAVTKSIKTKASQLKAQLALPTRALRIYAARQAPLCGAQSEMATTSWWLCHHPASGYSLAAALP